jgi:hypothetical protein
MRELVVLFGAAGLSMAQPHPFILGHLTAVSQDKIEVRDGTGIHALYSDTASLIWRGKDYRDFSVLHIGDEVQVTYRTDDASRQVVINLYANIHKVDGRITHVGANGFQVDENYNADPHSGYRRGLRQIVYDSGTEWEESLPEDPEIGRDVFIIGLKLSGGELQATRIIVYDGHKPVRMKPGTRVILPNGEIR